MRIRLLFLCALALGAGVLTSASAQTLYPGTTGEALLDSLAENYTPSSILSYGPARDTLFLRVDKTENDSLRGVYSGFSIKLDTNLDPTVDAYNKGINTEHVWPQSMGASSGNAKSDMHHLYPSRVSVNSSRGNLPFDEVVDAGADRWFCGELSLTSQPPPPTDQHCGEVDFDGDIFEPADSMKGDVARAMFYFYTAYRSVANEIFFQQQLYRLSVWHDIDPPEPYELARTWRIAAYQEGLPNPFIIDGTLVERAFFSTPLPIELSAFHAVRNGDVTRVSWDYLSTDNLTAVEVQSSSDGREFLTVRRVDLRADQRYTTTIPTGPATTHLRLAHHKTDGTVDYSAVIEIAPAFLRTEPVAISVPFPNPAGESATVWVSSVEPEVSLEVYDIAGRRLSSRSVSVGESETARVDLQLAHLASGTYTVLARTGSGVAVQRLTITR